MDEAIDSVILEKYAKASHDIVLSHPADLDSGDRAMPEMLSWCRDQGGIVVLQSGNILTSHPSDRKVQNCKIVMINQGLAPKRVRAATPELIDTLLIDRHEPKEETLQVMPTLDDHQQRLKALVAEALEVGARDIHAEVRQDMVRVRFRRHGELYLHAEWPANMGEALGAAAFYHELESDGAFNPSIPRASDMTFTHDKGRVIKLRLGSVPAYGGFDLVVRIVAAGEPPTQSLHALGFSAGLVQLMARAISAPSGAIILAGPTGAGKSATLASCLQLVHQGRKVYTIENPVEKSVNHATQIAMASVHGKAGSDAMGEKLLAMDPDVVVWGELGDASTARVMAKAALRGHLVVSTMQTSTAMGIISRLLDMGLGEDLITDPCFLQTLVCQHLVPKVCPRCAIPITQSKRHHQGTYRWQKMFGGHFESIQVRKDGGCEHCCGTGIQGRSVIAEMIWIDEAGRGFIRRRAWSDWEAHLREHGWESHRDRALKLIRSGLVDPIDAERVVGEIRMSHRPDHFQYYDYQ